MQAASEHLVFRSRGSYREGKGTGSSGIIGEIRFLEPVTFAYKQAYVINIHFGETIKGSLPHKFQTQFVESWTLT